ncbi:MAG: phosphopantothenoylcysteine decarboxylase/phosphopantothenate--cysteine ligase [Gammaproteobacteria bacterium]|jgi:phosphopantothenoylcysteine decarboxylase/phosphopantothenate--cysteine ligase
MAAMEKHTVFLYVSGAGSCVRTPTLVETLLASGATVHCVLTPNVAMVADPQALMDIPGNNWVRDYGHEPLERFPYGLQLVAPCTFNTLNKLAAGLADNLVTAMLGDAIGAGCKVTIAPGMNRGQWANPRVQMSTRTLEQWGCEIVPPQTTQQRVTLARTEDICAAVRRHTPSLFAT